MSDQPTDVGTVAVLYEPAPPGMGTIDEAGVYTPRQVTADDLDGMSLEDAIAGTIVEFDDGDIVKGTVVKVDKDEVLLDIGFKSEGVIPARELSIRHDVDPHEVVSMGDQIEALVLQKEDKDGRLILSKKRAAYERAWVKVEEKFNSGENVEGEVIEVVKGGLILDIGLRGFLPASLVDLRRVKDLTTYMGQRLEARVIEMDRNRNNVVLSRRVVLEEGRKHERQDILTKLHKGQILTGAVSSIVDFGAFVDLGGIDGLVHISELSWSHVNHPSEVVQVGDQVEVMVLDVDMTRERISLGLKQTQEDPWKQLVKNFPIGSIVKGSVTKLVPFGAFVEIGNGVEGLVHISEMAIHHVEAPEQVVTPGEELWVKIIDVDLERRRISLSIKQAAEGGTVAAEYREMYGEHNYDEAGNYIGPAFEAPAEGAAEGATAEGATAEGGAAADDGPSDPVAAETAPGDVVADAVSPTEVADVPATTTESTETTESGESADEPVA
jgi:small subunit ribosomal protein S1